MGHVFIKHKGLGQSDPNQISKYFTLADLTKTSQGTPNFPNDDQLENLTKLGELLDFIYERVGPFTILSAFRSQATQEAVKAGGAGDLAAQMAATNSLHTTGEAADITPTTMSLGDYFVRLFALDDVRPLLGQIVIKEDQNALHISTPTPRFPTGTPMKVMSDGSYVRLSQSEIQDWLSKNPITAALSLGAAVALGAGIFFLIRYIQKQRNPTYQRAEQAVRTASKKAAIATGQAALKAGKAALSAAGAGLKSAAQKAAIAIKQRVSA